MEKDHLIITMLDRLGALADRSAPRFEIGVAGVSSRKIVRPHLPLTAGLAEEARLVPYEPWVP